MGSEKVVDILLVEDNPGDVYLCTEMLKDAKVRNIVHVVNDGAAALDYLRRQGKYADANLPDLVLLDLNLPRVSGHDVLRTIKSDPVLKVIPVVIMTSSDADEDVIKAYTHHANSYVTKPVGLEQLSKIVKSIDDFWLAVVKFPGGVNR